MPIDIKGKHQRQISLDVSSGDTGDLINLSFSSENPVKQPWGWEVLSHEPGAMNLERAANGLPVLVGHNDKVLNVGKATDIHVDPADRKGRAVVRFASDPEAQVVLTRIREGISENISVGYCIDDYQLLDSKGPDGEDLYVITAWTPLEISVVSVPADVKVGVGRSQNFESKLEDTNKEADKSEVESKEESSPINVEDTVTEEPINEEPQGEVRSNTNQVSFKEGMSYMEQKELIKETLNIRNFAEKVGLTREADELLRSERSMSEVTAELMKIVAERQKPVANYAVDADNKEMREYNFFRAIDSIIKNENCAELEISKAIAQKRGSEAKGFYLPTNLPSFGTRAGLDSKTSGAGAETKFTNYVGFIEMLRNRAKVLTLGAKVLGGLQGNAALPVQTAGATAVWLSTENPGADIADSALQTSLVTLAPKTIMASTSFSKQLLTQSSLDIQAMVQNDLVEGIAREIDRAAINGSGASGQPKGVLNLSGLTTVSLPSDTNGAAIPGIGPLVDLEAAVATANADVPNMAYLTTPKQMGVMKKTQKWSGSVGSAIWEDGMINGYRAEFTNQVPSTLTKGTSNLCHAVIFANWADLLFGEWGAMDITIDPYRLKKQGMIELTGLYFVDVQARHVGSFAAITSAL